jgi:exopolysaccharide biosynthesis protein
MLRRSIFLITLILFASQPLFAGETTTRPMDCVTLTTVSQETPPNRYYIVTIDLTNPRVHIKVSRGGDDQKVTPPWETTLLPVSDMAQRDGLAVAINGNFFASKSYELIFGRKVPYFVGNWTRACGYAMNDGRLFSPTPLCVEWTSFVVARAGKVEIGKFHELPPDAWQVVSGVAQIITSGQDTAVPDTDGSTFAERAPRAVVAIDREGRTLFFLVCDGRRPDYSMGLTHHEIAQVLLKRGAWNALVLDGGGSATLVMRDSDGKVRLVSRPSDGHDLLIPISVERCVADALGVKIDPPGPQPTTQP